LPPADAIVAGARVLIRAGLLNGREAEVLSVHQDRARLSAAGLEVTLPLVDLALVSPKR
jgi:hypothetical protein